LRLNEPTLVRCLALHPTSRAPYGARRPPLGQGEVRIRIDLRRSRCSLKIRPRRSGCEVG
jgi:hypothetical protein